MGTVAVSLRGVPCSRFCSESQQENDNSGREPGKLRQFPGVPGEATGGSESAPGASGSDLEISIVFGDVPGPFWGVRGVLRTSFLPMFSWGELVLLLFFIATLAPEPKVDTTRDRLFDLCLRAGASAFLWCERVFIVFIPICF